MRPLILTQNITVDGSIEMLDDWFDPAADDPDQREVTRRDSAACDAILLGRQTFEDFRGYGRQEAWQDSPEGWPQSETYEKWLDSPDVAALYGPGGAAHDSAAQGAGCCADQDPTTPDTEEQA